MDRLLVSCVIPSYKRADTLRRAVNSVLAQTYRNIEVLVVDDNIQGDEYSISLRKILEEYSNDNRVRLITQPVHINGAEARNAGIRASKGKWIAFLDDDDEWLPTKIEKQMKALESNGDCYGASCFYNEYANGKLVHSCPPYSTENLNLKVLCRQVAMYTPTLILRKDKLMECGAFDNKLKRHQDLQLLAQFTFRNQMLVVPEILVNVHNDSLINRPNVYQFIDIKRQYFESINNVVSSYSPKEQKLIRNVHYYEIAFCGIHTKKYFVAIKYILKAGINMKSFKMLLQRFRDKKYLG